ncbi:alcohol dehydrogenase catalytic domain-containing protein [Actinobacillus equuli]|uniref:Ribulose-5-phosphate reductase n=1 Tax=Actinobacillus equuli TaxID=718 RepID=A0AAX3FJB3_ACTEU|nr:alcohol dehydrogenase catalytic domain-containing protein [Actinobacillus equuli]AIZ80235.1 ribitol-5-phosphate dehydrogenase [Actinobacillus equuli subsp. equuli]WGE44342.1 alcohol dehydrogenase catalytic domain-containing protein [Actinobacillus equuli subsp. equuli]VEE91549.1 alcohol dehydrogenase [Actinobacillus equuli]
MLNQVFQLVSPRNFLVKHEELNIDDAKVLVKPIYMALCHADQRYYQGKREPHILAKKLPMALIHEACGVVVSDPTNTFKVGQKVVMIPNSPPRESDAEFYENYMKGTKFLSSGFDGFMQEIVALPQDRLVKYDDIDDHIAVISEFVSVTMHAIDRFEKIAHSMRKSVVILGDGSLSYVLATSLTYLYPEIKVTVVGRNHEKLRMFNFVEHTYLTNEVPENISFDHAFECCGGMGSEQAVNDIIKYINPQGTVVLMGVSDMKVAINTRDILEKGLILVGSSRSGRVDFQNTIKMLENKRIQNRLKNILYEERPVKSITDIHRVFEVDLSTSFKTIFKWDI